MKLLKISVDDEGEPKPLFSIAYSKPNKRFTAKIIREDKEYDYVHYMRRIVKRVSVKKEASKKSRRKRQLPGLTIAPDERPDRDEIIQSSQIYKRIKLTSN